MRRTETACLLAGALALWGTVFGGPAARAEDLPPVDSIQGPTAQEVEDAVAEGGSLTGRELYERFLKNRIHSAVQHNRVISTDPGGHTQESRFWVRWKDFRIDDKADAHGVMAKTLVKFQEPDDMRHTGFLMVIYDGRDPEQFIYRPSERKVRRVRLRGAGVMGTDYTFDDIAFQDIEDADYVRDADAEVDGVPVYVVTATLKPFVDSQYARTQVFLDKETYVPLRARYWDHSEVEIRAMHADHESIKQFDDVWVATSSTMENLKEGTSTTVVVEKLVPDADITNNLFSTFQLQLRR